MFALRLSLALAFVGCLALAPVARAENPERYQEIEMSWPDQAGWNVIHSMPDLEPMHVEPGMKIRLLSRPAFTQRLRDAGLEPVIIWDDLQAHMLSEPRLAGWGSLYTYEEAEAAMDSLHAAYPTITTARFSLGNSYEGRPLWCMEVSKNPGVSNGNPEVLLDSEHHAREPITVSVTLDFVRWLGMNYGTDPEATFLVQNRQIYVVPMVNPDGYVYNEQTYPNGGGMWRKNRHPVGSGCIGVDNNRNYGFHWGGGGSSGYPCDDTYRGTAAFSEPENQVMRDFVDAHHFITWDSFHSNAALNLFPWGYTYTSPPELPLWNTLGAQMSRDNGYIYGPCAGTLYLADGVTFDWGYGDTVLKPKIYAFTTEVGGSDFWPQESEIPLLVAENLATNIYLGQMAGPYVGLSAAAVTGGDGNGRLDPGESAGIVATLVNRSVLGSADGVAITLATDDPYVQLTDAGSTVGSIAAGGTASNTSDPFRLTVDPAAPAGHMITFRVTCTWTGGGSNTESARFMVGAPTVLFSDDGESGTGGWSQDPSHSATTGAWVLVDPNPTAYQPGDDTTPGSGHMAWITGQNSTISNQDVDGGISAMRSGVWNLSGHSHVRLAFNYFFGQRTTGNDPTHDFFKVSLSNDGGATYPVDLISIGDVAHDANWTPAEFELEDYLPITSQMRMRLQASDGPGDGDIIEAGLDDVLITDAGNGDLPPTAPVAQAPLDGALLITPTPVLRVGNASDPDGNTLTYSFRVYSDALLTTLVRSADGVAEGPDATSWRVMPPLAAGTSYWWRADASDGSLRGLYSTTRSFNVAAGASVASTGGEAAAFQPAAPNPFRGSTTVRFSIPEAGPVRADIFDAAGRRVRSLYRGLMPGGFQSLSWDGADEAGRATSPGMYFMIVESGGSRQTIKLTLVR